MIFGRDKRYQAKTHIELPVYEPCTITRYGKPYRAERGSTINIDMTLDTEFGNTGAWDKDQIAEVLEALLNRRASDSELLHLLTRNSWLGLSEV